MSKLEKLKEALNKEKAVIRPVMTSFSQITVPVRDNLYRGNSSVTLEENVERKMTQLEDVCLEVSDIRNVDGDQSKATIRILFPEMAVSRENEVRVLTNPNEHIVEFQIDGSWEIGHFMTSIRDVYDELLIQGFRPR